MYRAASDLEANDQGQMYYRVEEDPAILSRASAVGGLGFSPSYVFIGTWSQIAEDGGTNTSPVSLLFLWHLLSVTHFIAFYCILLYTMCTHRRTGRGAAPPNSGSLST